jgi:hypothetical protein
MASSTTMEDLGLPPAKAGSSRCPVLNAILLQDLKSALLAKHLPGEVIRSRELRFNAVVLGEKQSENAGGGFSDKRLETGLF